MNCLIIWINTHLVLELDSDLADNVRYTENVAKSSLSGEEKPQAAVKKVSKNVS